MHNALFHFFAPLLTTRQLFRNIACALKPFPSQTCVVLLFRSCTFRFADNAQERLQLFFLITCGNDFVLHGKHFAESFFTLPRPLCFLRRPGFLPCRFHRCVSITALCRVLKAFLCAPSCCLPSPFFLSLRAEMTTVLSDATDKDQTWM